MANLAVFDINDYLLNGTNAGILMGYSAGNTLRPIIPTQQQPEFNELNSAYPYMVYSWRTRMDDDNWWLTVDDITYTIWASDYAQLTAVANEVIDAMRALDESASDINSWLMANRTDNQFLFHWARVVGSFSPQATDQEAGRLGWMITLRVGYVPLNGRHIS